MGSREDRHAGGIFMNRRTKTAADYAAIAIAPVLIFIMISSLVNFLTLVLYRGDFPERIQWTFLMVTMGSVAAARLSIEQDRGKSLGYLIALGGAAFFVLVRFAANPAFSLVLLTLIAWLSDVIVRDCTLIDDSKDSSDQGLIQSAGRGGHRPGRTVLYLAMAALPLFGIGQYFLRSYGNVWVGAQKLLAFYLFAALSLLVTTSFLGLRRYLRQRGAEMPTNVTVAWLAGGLAMVMGILLVATLAPLPGQAIASMKVPDFASATEGPQASRYGWGNEGTSQDAPGASKIQKPQDQKSSTVSAQKGAPPGQAASGNSKTGPAGNQSGGKKPSPKSDPSKQSSAQSPSGPKGASSKDSGDTANKPNDQGSKQESAAQSKTSDPQAKSGQAQDGPKPGQAGKPPEASQKQPQGSQPKPGDSENAKPSSEGKPQSSPTGKADSDKPPPNPTPSEKAQSEKPQSDPQESKPADSNPSKDDDSAKDASQRQPSERESSQDQSTPKEDSSKQPPSGEDTQPTENQDDQKKEQPDNAEENLPNQSESESSESKQNEPEPSESEQNESEATESEPKSSEPESPEPESPEPESPEPESNGPNALTTLLSAIANLIKPIILLACVVVVGYFLWTQWSAIQEWWRNLFHRDRSTASGTTDSVDVGPAVIPPRPFHSFTNPFQNASDPRQALLTTFAALEAFAREQGVARKNDETPSEFLQRMRSRLPDLAAGSAIVVDAYNRLLYGGIQRPTAGDLRAAEALWQQMKS
jgi:hypothetical protein